MESQSMEVMVPRRWSKLCCGVPESRRRGWQKTDDALGMGAERPHQCSPGQERNLRVWAPAPPQAAGRGAAPLWELQFGNPGCAVSEGVSALWEIPEICVSVELPSRGLRRSPPRFRFPEFPCPHLHGVFSLRSSSSP